MPQHTAKLNDLRIAPRKVRLVADLLRGLSVNEAEARLTVDRHRASKPLLKLLHSALAGARAKELNTEDLYVEVIRVDQGPMLKRYMARAQGRGVTIQKKTSHITLGLGANPSQGSGRFTMPEKKKKSKSEREEKRVRAPRKKEVAAEKPEKKPEGGFFKRAFGRKSPSAG